MMPFRLQVKCLDINSPVDSLRYLYGICTCYLRNSVSILYCSKTQNVKAALQDTEPTMQTTTRKVLFQSKKSNKQNAQV